MGPWFVRFESQPFRPGCSYETLLHLIERGTVRPDTAIRGPTTKQFWMLARWCPGVAHRLGICHSCQERVDPASTACASCGVEFLAATDRQRLGLGEVRALPGRSSGAGVEPGPTERAAEAPAPAEQPNPAAVETHAESETGAGVSPETQRLHRLQRELKRSRRWTKVWSVVVAVAVLGGGGYVLYGELDLDAGPVGKWLSASDAEGGTDDEASQPDEMASLGERGAEGEPADTRPDKVSGKNAELDGIPPAQDATSSEVPDARGSAPEGHAEAEITADPRLSALSGLRRLR